MQRIPWSEVQNSMAIMCYCNELSRCDQRIMSGELNPLKEVDYGTGTASAQSKDDHFMMYHFKVQRCPTNRGHHVWTDCMYLHLGEKARRRDPRKYHYYGKPCVDFRKRGQCENGDRCQFAHGVFETWLHPDKYKTQMCRDLDNCQRKVCFFAHSAEELREGDGVLEDMSDAMSPKSVLSMDQSPPQSPPQFQTNDITKEMERLILNGVQNTANGARNVAIGAVRRNSNCNSNSVSLEPKQIGVQTVEEPNLDWVAELVD